MVAPNLNLNPNLVPPDLTVYTQHRKFDIMAEMNCIGIGTIVSFDSMDQTVTVTLNYLRVIQNGQSVSNPQATNSDINNTNATLTVDKIIPPYGTPNGMPPLVKCPLIIAGGGASYLTFPVSAGDQCVILFNDRDIDNWWTTGGTSAPNTNRLHDLSDAMVFIGPRSMANLITGYNMNGPQLTNGNAFVSVEDKIRLSVAGGTLRAALDSLMTALLNWVDTEGDTPNPATLVALNQAKTLIDGVLK